MFQDSRRPGTTNACSIPQLFELNDGVRQRAATVVWRRTGVLGIRFDDYCSGR